VPVPPADLLAGTVLHQALPQVPKSALRTIHGIIKLRVRVDVDDKGEVRKSRLETAGPSKYFARVAVESARDWKFNPPQKNGAKLPSVWTLHYEFTRSGVRAKATSADTSG
jgi:TonB family protein